MISAYLLLSEICDTANSALELFKSKRTVFDDKRGSKIKNNDVKSQGVTAPSQIRFVHYYEKFITQVRKIYEDNPELFKIPDTPLTDDIQRENEHIKHVKTHLIISYNSLAENHNEFSYLLKNYFNKSVVIESIRIYNVF